MAFAPTSPVTGSSQTLLTSPTFTIAPDTSPEAWGKQFYVAALGGTQTGVLPHTVAAPFTLSMFRPKVPAVLAPVNPVTGVLRSVPMNTYKVITRKGVLPLPGQAHKTAIITTTISVPAGADTADPVSLSSALSAHIGLLTQQSAGIGGTLLTAAI